MYSRYKSFPGYVVYINIFSKSIACLLILSTRSLTEQTFLILMQSNLSIFYFTVRVFGVKSKNSSSSLSFQRLSSLLKKNFTGKMR